jgi:MFS family permease
MMICAGASEQGVSQWASAFAEKGLGVTKTVGDLAGPMAFACLMGISRAFYGKFGHKIELDKFMNLSCILCIVSYLTISLVPNSVVGLIGCALCGLSVGIMWPGSFSKASASIKRGGTALFALLALGGDLGCTAGPTLVGFVSGRLNDNMRMGILVGTIFPILLLLGIYLCKKEKARNS